MRAVDSITGGLGWTKAAEHVIVSGAPGKDDREACWELGATVAAGLMEVTSVPRNTLDLEVEAGRSCRWRPIYLSCSVRLVQGVALGSRCFSFGVVVFLPSMFDDAVPASLSDEVLEGAGVGVCRADHGADRGVP